MRADTLEYATATITADHDITGKVIEVSLPVTANPPVTWVAADVVEVTAEAGGRYKAKYRVLIGPAGQFTLTPQVYDWTVRLTDDPEIPVRKVDQLTITAA
jgi:hypothetical protein